MRVLWACHTPAPALDERAAEAFALVTASGGDEDGGLFEVFVIDRLDAASIAAARRQATTARFIMVTDRPSQEEALAAMRAGAIDYLTGGEDLGEQLVGALRREQDRRRAPEDDFIIDGLTGLAAHAVFHEALRRAIAESQRFERPLSVVLADVDDFEVINDRSGHHLGDRLLREMATLLSGRGGGVAHRSSDLISRLVGDRFALLLTNTNRRGAAVKANRLRLEVERHAFPDAIVAGGKATLSLGVASWASGPASAKTLLEEADAALQAAKRRGKNRVVTWSPSLDDGKEDLGQAFKVEIALLQALEESINGGLFKMAFQPIVHVASGQPLAYEALTRPSHDAFPGPYQLFTTAERAGRVADLGRATRKKALDALDALPEGRSLFLNLHPLELNADLEREAKELLAPHAPRLVLEITETAELPDTPYHRDLIRSLREAGFRVALDDLGAGYAGLTSLSTLKPDIVKLDMKLIRQLQTEPATARLLRHIIDFADGERMDVVAEGVETHDEAQAAADLGCHLLQGYYFARPGPPFPALEGSLSAGPSSDHRPPP